MNSYKIGVFFEAMAVVILTLKGYCIRDVRYKTSMGEIDVIATKGKMLIFVEVKRRKRGNDVFEAISHSNKKRIERTAQHFLSIKPEYQYGDIRFDAILFKGFFGKHVKQAWISNL